MEQNWLKMVAERIRTDEAFAEAIEAVSTQEQLKTLLTKEGVSFAEEELPEMLAYLEGWRERGHALTDEELEALSGGMVIGEYRPDPGSSSSKKKC